MAHVFAISKYAAFVWPAYGISGMGIVAAIILTLRGYARAKERLHSIERAGK